MKKYLLVCFVLGLNSLVLWAQSEWNAEGNGKAKAVKTKKENIKYSYHVGAALLKTGLTLSGKFQFNDKDNDLPDYNFIDTLTNKRKSVPISMIERMVLAGAEKGITARNDSTEFVWIDKFKDLYRKVRIGTIEIYDNSRIIDEKYENLEDYLLVAGHQQHGYKLIKKVADVTPLMTDRPYFMQSLAATGRSESKDFRILIYLVDLFNESNPMRVLKWQDMTLELRKVAGGGTLQAKGYVQPLDLRNEYVQTGSIGYVHIFDGKDFRLLTSNDIEKLTINGTTYEKVFYGVTQKYCWATSWKYKEENDMVTKRIITANNYFFRHKVNDGQDLVILRSAGDAYNKPINEPELRKIYLTEIKVKESLNTPPPATDIALPATNNE